MVILSGAVCIIWIFLLLGRKRFWIVRVPAWPGSAARPTVAAVMPARNEAGVVGRAVGSLLASSFPAQIYLVDDHSTDGTAEAAGNDERLHVISARALPAGWTGKLWAVAEGIEAAAETQPEYYLLTDADIEHAPANLGRLVARAEAEGFDMVSLMVKLHCRSLAERALIPAFVFFFFMLYPPGAGTRGAAGGCILIRRAMLERIGGIAKIRGEMIDDCALAREVNRAGGRVWLGVTQATRSLRGYAGFGDVESMIARTAFTQLGYSPWMLLGAVAGMALTYLAPPLLAAMGYKWGAVAWLLMSIAYAPVLRFYGRSLAWGPLLPLVALFYTGATVHSAVRYWKGEGGLWKGRTWPNT